jgi:hypothetical protein
MSATLLRDVHPAPAREARPALAHDVRRSRSDLLLAGVVLVWVPLVLWLDRGASLGQQRLLGAGTVVLLLVLLRREVPLVRAQVAVVVAFATAVEYTFSPLLEVYVYRLDNVPAFVPPGHGLVYLAALALGRTQVFARWRVPLIAGTVVGGGGWALRGVIEAERTDALGAFWFLCLLGFLRWGRSTMLYVGAFVVVSYLEVLGTRWGTWAWAPVDPIGLVAIGNPPSGAAGGYGWFDLAALLAAPALLRCWLDVRRHWRRDVRRPVLSRVTRQWVRSRPDMSDLPNPVARYAAEGRGAVTRRRVRACPRRRGRDAGAAPGRRARPQARSPR